MVKTSSILVPHTSHGWLRIATDLKYNPYWPIRREELKPEDLPARIQFSTWIFNNAKMANFKRSKLP